MQKQLPEKPLGPLVIIGITGDNFPPPIEHGTHGTQLAPHICHVLFRPVPWMDSLFNGSILCGQAKSVKPNREKDIIPLHAFKPGARI